MQSNSPFRLDIVGGGIAGLTAAIALRAPDRRITVLEQSRLNTEIGALISLQPNASKIIYETFGLGKELEELVNEVPLTTDEYGASRIVYHQKYLHDTLKKAALATDREGGAVEIRVSSRVIHCNPFSGTVETENGDRVEGDVSIGADGIHSVLRKYVLEDEIIPLPTCHSEPEFYSKINLRSPFSSMMVAHDCRLVMGPGRQGELFGIVALVPDERMNEDPNAKQSWVSEGSLAKMLGTSSEFPEWVTSIFKRSWDLGVWQLRDIDPLHTWYRGRVLLISDAAHVMLPTQGQGASQAIEDAEALGAFFADQVESPSVEKIGSIFEDIFRGRYNRAGLIQWYSRQAARPGASKEGNSHNETGRVHDIQLQVSRGEGLAAAANNVCSVKHSAGLDIVAEKVLSSGGLCCILSG